MDCQGHESLSKSKNNRSVDSSNASPSKPTILPKPKQSPVTPKSPKQKSPSQPQSHSHSKSNPKPKQKSLSTSHPNLHLQQHSKQKHQSTRYKTLQAHSSKSKQKQKSTSQLKKQLISSYDKKIRRNNKKFISRENSLEYLPVRKDWGVDQSRLKNYALVILEKIQKGKKQSQKRENTFNTDKSSILKESEVKLQLTPKKVPEIHQNPIANQKIKEKIIRSPNYPSQQKTNKKRHQKKQKQASEQKQTQKQRKKSQQEQQPTTEKLKERRFSQLLSRSLSGEFQCLEKNNFYSVNFRVVNKKILEIQLAFVKKAEAMTVNLIKGSLQCQSISESYHNVSGKSSIILMTAVSGVKKCDNYIYPQLQITLTQKNGNFNLQKKLTLPYNQLFLVQPLCQQQLKHTKLPSKIKNKSIIDDIPYSKQMLLRMQKIFGNNFTKYKIKEHLFYLYGFRFQGELSFVRIVVSGGRCILQCESSCGANTKEVLEMFLPVLGIL